MRDGRDLAAYDGAAERALRAVSDGQLRVDTARIFAATQRLIDSAEINLVVIAARRLACLYQLLVKAGMPSLTGCLVVSNRVFEANPSIEWGDARVLVLDDSVVVGTTLYRLHGELRDLGASHVVCRAVCVDRDQQVDYLLSDIDFEAMQSLATEDVSVYSKEVVFALFANQVPFFTDYATTVPVTLSKAAWIDYLSDGRWHVADVTAPLLDDDVHTALALIPTEETFARLTSRVSPAAAELIDGFKLRLYAADLGESVDVVTVPIAMLGPCSPDVLDETLRSVCSVAACEDTESGIDFQQWDPKAKHRLVQLYLSACLLAEAWPALSAAAGSGTLEPTVADLEDQQLRLYFGDLTDRVLNLFTSVVAAYATAPPGRISPPSSTLEQPTPSRFLDEDAVRNLLWDTRELVAATGLPCQPSTGELTKLGLIFAHGITSLFGFVSREFEMPQRREIAALPDAKTYELMFSDRSTRLLYQGFTLKELATTIAPECLAGSPWQRAILSLGVDAGNDLGVIVPVTRFDEGRNLVYRCYRLGETAGLAERPLTEIAQSSDSQLDDMSQASADGFPTASSVRPIAMALESPDRSGSEAALLSTVRDAVPGVAVSRFVGMITAIDGGRFQADLRDPMSDDIRTADMALDQFVPAEAAEASVGTRFLWSIRQDDRGGTRRRVSVIRPLNDAALDLDRLRAIGDAITSQRLADGESADR